MSDFSYIRRFEHPYASNDTHAHFRRTTYTHSPFSAAAVPFGWMMRGDNDLPDPAGRLALGYRHELEPDVGFDSIWVQERRNQLVMLEQPLDFWTPSILILRTGGDDGEPNFSEAFKRDAVAQITERGYPVAEVSQRLGVSAHSLYAWTRQLTKVVSGDAGKPPTPSAASSSGWRFTRDSGVAKCTRRFTASLARSWSGYRLAKTLDTTTPPALARRGCLCRRNWLRGPAFI